MMAKEKETEQYLKYPLRLQWEDFSVWITQTGQGFTTRLTYDALLEELFIKHPIMHQTLHLALLWANNELDYLETINTSDEE